jgi:hypothetical protein
MDQMGLTWMACFTLLGLLIGLVFLLANRSTRWPTVWLLFGLVVAFLSLIVLRGQNGTTTRQMSLAGSRMPGDVVVPEAPAQPTPKVAAGNTPAEKSAGKTAGKQPAVTRPAWVESGDSVTAEGYQKAVVAGPYSTALECQQDLPQKVLEATEEYVSALHPDLDAQFRVPAEALMFDDPRLVRETYEETRETSVGPMKLLHARLLFDRKVKLWLDQKLSEAAIGQRLWVLGLGAVGVLLALAVVYAILRAGTQVPGASPAATRA